MAASVDPQLLQKKVSYDGARKCKVFHKSKNLDVILGNEYIFNRIFFLRQNIYIFKGTY